MNGTVNKTYTQTFGSERIERFAWATDNSATLFVPLDLTGTLISATSVHSDSLTSSVSLTLKDELFQQDILEGNFSSAANQSLTRAIWFQSGNKRVRSHCNGKYMLSGSFSHRTSGVLVLRLSNKAPEPEAWSLKDRCITVEYPTTQDSIIIATLNEDTTLLSATAYTDASTVSYTVKQASSPVASQTTCFTGTGSTSGTAGTVSTAKISAGQVLFLSFSSIGSTTTKFYLELQTERYEYDR